MKRCSVCALPTLAAGDLDEYEYVSDCSHGGIGCIGESTAGCRQGDNRNN
jgi:hypothetical protein